MVIVKSEFALALNQVASERGISVEDVIQSMEAAIMAAFRKEHPEFFSDDPEEDNGIFVKIDINTGETHIMQEEEDITPPGFGRIAAQTARQVIIQKIREAEKKTVISHYQDQVGTIIRGRVIRRDMNNVYIDLGKAEGVVPREEQIRNETYIVNNRYVFFLKEIGTSKAGYSRIVLSRTAPELISELFKREVPEISSGTVEIKQVVREPGERAKIAVFSSQSGVDPVGACVGQKGVRVQTVTDELNGKEKIDIIQWNEDIKVFIISALSPAQVISVEINEKEKQANVTVTEEQAPLAIGKGGVNVNLAARLTGYDIDIVQLPSEKEEKAAEAPEEKEPEVSESSEEPKETTEEQGAETKEEQSVEAEAADTENTEEPKEAEASVEKSEK